MAAGILVLLVAGSVGPLLTRPISPGAPPIPAAGAARSPLGLAPIHASGHLAATTPRPSAVSPYTFHTTEPAPAGVTDYGVDAAQNPYYYSTSMFQASASIRSLLTYKSGAGTAAYDMTFQLNVVLHLTNGPNELDYWIQNVVNINTSAKSVYFLNNVWNLSSSAGHLNAGDVSGNGTINSIGSTTWYAAVAAYGLPGNFVYLSYPTTVSVRVISSDATGTPHVAFQYADGFGWVTYDNVSVNAARGWGDSGFWVTGYQYTPIGVFFDAEFDFTGTSSPGSTENDVLSNLD
ncbi:MAG: thermopsin [Thermoplasmata archaeon]|nr:thermopsin [Thermoplasmata archaeon]